jgi:hypothetical protein
VQSWGRSGAWDRCGTLRVMNAAGLARLAHPGLEPLHTMTYQAPEVLAAYSALGITGWMRGYFASRSAPLGQVPAEVVIATFYNFSPRVIRKVIPSVWDLITPEEVTTARYVGVSAAYERILGAAALDSPEMAEAARLAREATTVLTLEGRPLYAAYAALAWPEPAHLQLFHAVTLLRESRGDGHIAALVLAGLSGIEAFATYLPLAAHIPPKPYRQSRGWSDEEWDETVATLVDRGLLDPTGALTERGAALREDLEVQTDQGASSPYELLGEGRTARLLELVEPWTSTR